MLSCGRDALTSGMLALRRDLTHTMVLMPNTKQGRIGVRLLAACAAIFAVAIAVSMISEGPHESSAFDLYRFLVGTSFLLTGAGSVVAGVIAFVRDRERALLVIGAVALGLLAVAFALGDVIFS